MTAGLDPSWTPLLLALAAGVSYGLAAIFCKRALETGAGTFRSLAYSNWFITLCFIPFPLLAEKGFTQSEIELGFMLGVLFCASQVSCFLALRRGDASVATPILGTKTLFVAVFGYFIYAKSLPEKTWLAAILAVVAVVLLGWPAKGSKPSFPSMGLALLTAAGFGLTDALVPEFAKKGEVDPLNLIFMMVFAVGLFSFIFIPLTRGRFLGWRGQADKWLILGTIPLAAQAILMSLAIGFYDVPTEANVFYMSRGLWSVLFAAWIGRMIGASEGSAPKAVLVRRLIGAALLLVGIYLAPTG